MPLSGRTYRATLGVLILGGGVLVCTALLLGYALAQAPEGADPAVTVQAVAGPWSDAVKYVFGAAAAAVASLAARHWGAREPSGRSER